MDLLLKNKVLTHDLMGDIEYLFGHILVSPVAPYIDVNHMRHNLEHLEVKETSQNTREAVIYNPSNNTIYVNPKHVDQYDYKFLLTKGLIKLAGKNEQDHNPLAPINEGIADNLSEVIIGNESLLSVNDDEKIIAHLLGKIYGDDVLLKSFFDNKSELLDKVGYNKQLLSDINNNYNNRFKTGKSLLGEIQMQLIDLFMSKENVTYEEMSDFALNLYGNSYAFGNAKNMYLTVDQVYSYFVEQRKNKLGKQM